MSSRILVIVQNAVIEADKRVQRELAALTAVGYKATLICPDVGDVARRAHLEGVTILRYRPPAPGYDFWTYFREYLYSWKEIARLTLKAYWNPGFDAIHA